MYKDNIQAETLAETVCLEKRSYEFQKRIPVNENAVFLAMERT